MASGKSSKAVRNARSVVTATKPKPWGTVAAVLAILIFAAGIFGYVFWQYGERRTFIPSAENQDPSAQIEGVVVEDYDNARKHVGFDERVAYDQIPPFGGAHQDGAWAACEGQVYQQPVRNEYMVHSLEHGAVWIAYNPEQISGAALDSLRQRVQDQSYIMLSPYPGLGTPVSLQSWGHQLKLSDPNDERIDQFIQSLRLNQYTYPEPGASCDIVPGFDPANPPPFVEPPDPGEPGAVPVNASPESDPQPAGGAAPAPGGEQPAPAPPPAGG